MTDCDFCRKPVLDGHEVDTVTGSNHEVCRLEAKRRLDDKICTMCGVNRADSKEFKCSDCEYNVSDYSGYEGPK